ncbi:MAG: hypothetical protein O2807_02080 [bacterium]|nr:hypothetical protein [bacterium]
MDERAAMQEEIPRLRAALAADPERVAREVASFPDAEFTRSLDAPAWARWSPEIQLRHIAYVPCRWLLDLLRAPLRERGHALPPVDMAAIQSTPGRWIPAGVCHDRESLLSLLREMIGFALEVLDREGPDGLLAVTCVWEVDLDEVREDEHAEESALEFWRRAAGLHPIGVRESPEREGHFLITLGAALRQIHWEILAHVRSLQRFGEMYGRPPVERLPREGYLSLPKFWD